MSQVVAEQLGVSRAADREGGDVVVELWGVHTFDRGRWVRTQWFWSRDEALKAAGLSE